MTATTMPEAIRQNRANLETGHPPAADKLFGQWTRKTRRQSSSDTPALWDGVDAAQLDAGRGPADLLGEVGQQTGLEEAGDH